MTKIGKGVYQGRSRSSCAPLSKAHVFPSANTWGFARKKPFLSQVGGFSFKEALLRENPELCTDVPNAIRQRFPWLELIWADGGYNAWQGEAAVAKLSVLRMEIVKRSDDVEGFVVLPHRWVVEHTFSWSGRNRRIAKDFENLAETLATFRYPHLHPAYPQAACQSGGRETRQITGARYARAPRRQTFKASGDQTILASIFEIR